MRPFGKAKRDRSAAQPDATSAIRDLTERFERMERTLRDIKQNVDLVPALLRKMYLADVKLEPPYDLQAERFSFSSQNDEDGLVLALVKRIGFTNRRFVELGCGMNGGNSGFLASEMGWHGLMVDARDDAIRKIVIRFTGHDVAAKHRRVTREDVNEFITDCGFAGEIDLLSIDIDGMDYWIWQALTACNPRLVAIEYNWLFGPERAVTVPYDSAFDLEKVGVRSYHGASLAALVDLGRCKGYRLVATERVNAFFLRNDVAPEIREIDARLGYRAPVNFANARQVFTDLERAGLPLVTVGTAVGQ
jgi:hypothetical protein